MKIKISILSALITVFFFLDTSESYCQNFMWAKSIRGTQITNGTDLCIDSQGNIIITGSFSNNTDFLYGTGVVNATGAASGVYLAKYSFDGTLIWVKGMSIGSYNSNSRHKVNVDSSDNIFLAGSCQPYNDFDPSANTFNTLSSTAFVAKYTSSGDFIYAKNIGDSGAEFSSFTIDNNDNIIITGSFSSVMDFNPDPSVTFNLNSGGTNSWNYGRLFILKLTSAGNFVFAQNFGSSSSGLSLIDDVEVNSLNEIIVITKLESGPMNLMGSNPPLTNPFGDKDVFLIKIPSNGGSSLWYRQINAQYPLGEGFKLDVTTNDEILITGQFSGLFNLLYWGSTSFDLSSQNTMELDVCIIKASTLGNLIWAKKLTGTASIYATDIESNQNGDIYVTGEYLGGGVQDYTLGGGQVFGNYTYTEGHGFYILKISSLGVSQFVRFLDGQINEPGGTHPTNIAISPDQNTIFTMGIYSFDNFDVDPGTLTSNMGSAGTIQDVFLHAMCERSAISATASNTCVGSDILLQTPIMGGEYNWNGPNGFTSNIQNPTIPNSSILNSGAYNLTITFDHGCQLTATTALQVSPPSTMVANSTTEFCEGDSVIMATISSNSIINVSGPNGYSNLGSGTTIAINPVTAASAGQYNITATDNGGCVINAVFTITSIKPSPVITIVASDVDICLGGTTVLTASGGSNITWDNGVNNGVSFSPLNDVTYIASGLGANGCEGTESIYINTNPLPFVTSSSSDNSKCSGVCDGAASANATGSTSPYTYQWDASAGSQTSSTALSLCAGAYYVTVTDANGCNTQKNVSVTQATSTLSASTLSTTSAKCSGACVGSSTLSASGGIPPYSYLWSPEANNQTTETAISLCQGIYSVVITDMNGCTVQENSTIAVNTTADPNIYLTNLAAVDQINISPSFAAFYTYNLPASIIAPPSNPRNFVDPGKKARFKVECTNEKFNGQSIVSGICKVRSNNPYITITDSSSALNNIGWNDKAWSADEFEINIDPNTPPGTNAYIDFIVQESGQEYSTTCIAIPITPLVYSPTTPFTIDDDSNPDSQGNDNDICDPNEIIEFYPWLDNISTLDAEFVRGRFENLDNLSYINIWNGVPGINTTVYDAGWWNYSFAQPQTINSNSFNTTPEYDFVFNYNYPFVTDFKLFMVMAGGFKLFSGTALSLVQWSLPYTFSGTGSTSTGSEIETNDGLSVYPNPSNGNVKIQIDNSPIQHVKIYSQIGALIYQSEKETQELNLTGYPKGVYLIQVQSENKVFNKKIIIY